MSTPSHKPGRGSLAAEAAAELTAIAEKLGLNSRAEVVAMLADFIPDTKAEYDAIKAAAEHAGESVPEFMQAAAQWRAKSLAAIAERNNSPEAKEAERAVLDAYHSALKTRGDASKVTVTDIRALCGARNEKSVRILQSHGLEYNGWKPGQASAVTAEQEPAEKVAPAPVATAKKKSVKA